MVQHTTINNYNIQNVNIANNERQPAIVDNSKSCFSDSLNKYIERAYKKCKNDFSFEETMKPRRELTIPSEGKLILI